MVPLVKSRRRTVRTWVGQWTLDAAMPGRRTMRMRLLILLTALPFMLFGMTASLRAQQPEMATAARRVIIFVWDGLRADDLTPEIAPNYFALARSGVVFADHHAVYPTFTMINSASIATGTYPGVHGFYGNVVYAPSAKGRNAKGAEIDFFAPAFIEDFGVVEAVRDLYQGRLTLVPTMLEAAQAKGLTTVAVGKFGAAFIQDCKRGGIILDEDAAMPLGFAKELQQGGYRLPRNSSNAYDAGALMLAKDNGDPMAPIPIQRLKDAQTSNPLDCSGALSRPGFAYLTDVFVNYILPNKKPDLTIFWSKEPDATNYAYGPGTCNSIDATRMNDEILGRVVEKLRQLGWEASTDIIITQDHNHSTVSGDVAYYPLRAIVDRGIGAGSRDGYSVSGFVRTAELLTRDGMNAFDGAGCRDIPILSGIMTDGTHLHSRKDDEMGHFCGRPQKYTSPSYAVPKLIPAGAVVVAANAGSDYLFVPDANIETVKAAVVSLQSRLLFGAIFVSDKYGEIAGTLPMSLIKTETSGNGRAPDIIVSFTYDENVAVAGKPGVSYASSVNRRGDHGSFSPTDTHISLMASGPDFASGLHNTLPTSNVDVAPTVARILKFNMPDV
jgi:arylsulfatase A-like enzyme